MIVCLSLFKRVLPNGLTCWRVPSRRLLLISYDFLPLFHLGCQALPMNLLLSWLVRTWILSRAYPQLTGGVFFAETFSTLFKAGFLVSMVVAGQDDIPGSGNLSMEQDELK